MFQTAVLGLVIASFALQCQCQQQRFVELPFDDSEPTTQRRFSKQEQIPALPQGFGQSPTLNHRFSTFNQEPTPISIPAAAAAPHVFSATVSSPPEFRFQDFNARRPQQVKGSTRHLPTAVEAPRPIFRATPAAHEFVQNQPTQGFQFGQPFPQNAPEPRQRQGNQFPQPLNLFAPTQPIDTPPRSSLPNPDAQLFDSVSQSPKFFTSPTNTFFSIEEPTLRSAQTRPQQRTPVFRAPQPPRFIPQEPQQQPQFALSEQPRSENVQRPVVHHPHRFPSLNSDLQQDHEEKLFRQQAENAKYSFASQIDDNISGNQHQREEMRDGLAVKGKYSYSDGYVKRTVYYEADDKGYRVVKEEEEPLGNGPQVDPNGQANVSTFVSGNTLQYSITGADIQDQQKKLGEPTQTQPPFRGFGGRS